MDAEVSINDTTTVKLAQEIINKRAKNIKKLLVPSIWGENTANVFYKTYQNSILTTAEYLPEFSEHEYHSYAGTGGWGCYGPPQKFPIPEDEYYPYSLSPMWIRDACALYHGYLGVFSNPELNGEEESSEETTLQTKALGRFIEGLIRTCCLFLTRKEENITAHAFNRCGSVDSAGKDFEPDSLAYVIFLAADYEKASGQSSHLDLLFWKTVNKVVEILSDEKYLIPLGSDIAMIKVPTRPSDDPVFRYFNIPVNAFVTAMMDRVIDLAGKYSVDVFHFESAISLRDKIRKALATPGIGIFDYGDYKKIFPFETDAGYKENRGSIFMDDSGIPSLLSLPYIGFCTPDFHKDTYETYLNTREFLLTTNNPFFFEGENYKGIGSPHTENKGYTNSQKIPSYGYGNQHKGVWPMAIIMQGMTATDKDEIKRCLKMAVDSTQFEGMNPDYGCDYARYFSTGWRKERSAEWFKEKYPNKDYIRESFEAKKPQKITRGWFAWVNSLFGEWIEKMVCDGTLST